MKQPNTNNSFVHFIPQGPLANYVDVFWYCRGRDFLKGMERVLPTPGIELVIDLTSKYFSTLVSGPKSKPATLHGFGNVHLLGVHFKPRGLYPFISVPLQELKNTSVGAEELWSKECVEMLLDKIHRAADTQQLFMLLQQWLLSQAMRKCAHGPVLGGAIYALHQCPTLKTSQLAQSANLSQRRFIQLFHEQIGFTPKLFSRLQRFRRSLSAIGQRTDIDWLDISLQCGYFDQAHFIHEFSEFSGVTPSQYMALRSTHEGHMAVS